MDALFPLRHSGMQLTSDEVVRLPSKGPETDLFYLKRLRTWEKGAMISLMLSPLWTGSLMMVVFKTVLQKLSKGMASEQTWAAARSRQVLRMHNFYFHWEVIFPLWMISFHHSDPASVSIAFSRYHSEFSTLSHTHMPSFSLFKCVMPLKFYLEKLEMQRIMPKSTYYSLLC